MTADNDSVALFTTMHKKHSLTNLAARAVAAKLLLIPAALLLMVAGPQNLPGAEPCRVVLTDQKSTPLNLDWKYARGSLPAAKEVAFDDLAWAGATPPFRWSSVFGSYSGEIWMRCHIVLAGPRPDLILLRLEKTGDAFEAYFNGSPVGRDGSISPFSVGTGEETYVELPAGLWAEENVIALRVYGTGPLTAVRNAPVLIRDPSGPVWALRFNSITVTLSYLLIVAAFGFVLRALITLRFRENALLALIFLTVGLSQAIRHGMRNEWFESNVGATVTQFLLILPLPVILLEFVLLRTGLERNRRLRFMEFAVAIPALGAVLIPALPATFQPSVILIALLVSAILLVVFVFVTVDFFRKKSLPDDLKAIGLGILLLLIAGLNDLIGATGLVRTPATFIFACSAFLVIILWQISSSILEMADQTTERSEPQTDARMNAAMADIRREFQTHCNAFRTALKPSRAKNARKNTDGKMALERWIEDAGLLAQMQDETLPIRQTRFSIRELVEAAAREATESTGERMNRLLLHLPPAGERFWSDLQLIRTCLFHLMENALLYSTGRIEVRAERAGNTLQLRIRDEGPGMSADLQEHVFEPFVRGQGKSTPGSGLGLTLVDRSVAILGGQLHMESGQGFFTLFEIDLPEMQEKAT